MVAHLSRCAESDHDDARKEEEEKERERDGERGRERGRERKGGRGREGEKGMEGGREGGRGETLEYICRLRGGQSQCFHKRKVGTYYYMYMYSTYNMAADSSTCTVPLSPWISSSFPVSASSCLSA